MAKLHFRWLAFVGKLLAIPYIHSQDVSPHLGVGQEKSPED